MAGISDLMGLFYWLDNEQDYLLEASLPTTVKTASAPGSPPTAGQPQAGDPKGKKKPPASNQK
jgi:hypothetical protein